MNGKAIHQIQDDGYFWGQGNKIQKLHRDPPIVL